MHKEIDGIKIEIIKKNIKNLHLYVKTPDGRVVVSAPKYLSYERILEFVHSKIVWIREQQVKILSQPHYEEKQYVDGDFIYVIGKKYALKVEYGFKKNQITMSDDILTLSLKKEFTQKQKEKLIKEYYREILKKVIEIYLPKWENITNLHCESWQTKDMKTRWGTCNTTTRTIWFSLGLAQKPIECIEYVILHELSHLKVKCHGKDFKAILDKFMPEWREVKKKLNLI